MTKTAEDVMDQAIEDIESSLGVNETPYDPADWLSKTIEEKGLQETTVTTYARKKSFKQICQIVRDDLGKILEKEEKTDTEQKEKENEWLELQHAAIIGDEKAMGYFISRIMEVLRQHNITSIDFPNFYDSLAEAIFHEVWGTSILYKWEKYPKSEAAVVRGTELWIDIDGKFVKQDEQFEDIDTVERLKRTFTMRTKDAVINEQVPELEIEREDGSRITMIQKPRARENYIMFRRFIVKDISLYEQARLKTIKEEDVDIFRALSRTMPNTIFAGRVRSAKSTFMKSMLRERSPDYVLAVMEKHFELGLTEQLNDRLCFEVQAKEGDLHHAMPRLLRMEHDSIVVGEIRSLETEGYLQACERGERGAYSTYHLTDIQNVVPQITRHILDEFPNRKFENELERVARNIDIIVTMSADRDRRRKRVIGVTEIIWDEEKKRHFTKDLIRYSSVTDEYYYSSDISKRLLYLMAAEDMEETKRLVKLLRERENVSPMAKYEALADNILKEILGDDANG
ncbi:CpaF/VirB11 family protein [Aquibacillus sp. 3ASR75-11]|uniref:CpaF/VirB11 family protein n=1 Tax=Terrihalobacillus insolitus TaxID=2950438 RepID=A0A9X3WT05_9BACI|nr:ATPase, T2SS/T4P/T4SS family [Terrihalobacillus insolitus]MDC3424303.1 CpaF/VirB11 family protein [Terrihalobacillus insolitus]